jgi:hypothetical protein
VGGPNLGWASLEFITVHQIIQPFVCMESESIPELETGILGLTVVAMIVS